MHNYDDRCTDICTLLPAFVSQMVLDVVELSQLEVRISMDPTATPLPSCISSGRTSCLDTARSRVIIDAEKI